MVLDIASRIRSGIEYLSEETFVLSWLLHQNDRRMKEQGKVKGEMAREIYIKSCRLLTSHMITAINFLDGALAARIRTEFGDPRDSCQRGRFVLLPLSPQ
jgi:hypothetical protein